MNINTPNPQKTKNLEFQITQKSSIEDRQFTFKIIKRRSPWSKTEDDAIIELVNKHGTGNWTIIANEMASSFGFKNRSGKQCRERWHNHLDPNVNKDSWTEKEENILFSKHLEYGNKWSDIAKFLPGRTDNAIKNHFYSKFRKYIRKILKQINKENLMKLNGIDSNQYNGDKIYKLLKKHKIAYKNLNKDTLLGLIVSVDKNIKLNNENGSQFLKNKTKRAKSTNSNKNLNLLNTTSKNSLNGHSNEKLLNEVHSTLKRKNSNNSNNNINNQNNSHNFHHNNKSHLYLNFLNHQKPQKKRKRTKRRKVSICLSTPENKKSQINKSILLFNIIIVMPSRKFFYHKNEKPKDTKLSKTQKLKEDLTPSSESFESNFEFLRPGVELHQNKILIINKNILEQKTIANASTSSISTNNNQLPTSNFQMIKHETITTNNNTNIPQSLPHRRHPPFPELNLNLTEQMLNSVNPTPHYGNIPIDDSKFYFFENQPQLSPMNLTNVIIYPPSTRNLFNLDITSSYNYENFKNQSTFILATPKQSVLPTIAKTPNREIALQNKILINEQKDENGEKRISDNKNNEFKPPQIDLSLVNQSETNAIFMESLGTNKNYMISTNKFINPKNLFDLSPISAFMPKQNDYIDGNKNI